MFSCLQFCVFVSIKYIPWLSVSLQARNRESERCEKCRLVDTTKINFVLLFHIRGQFERTNVIRDVQKSFLLLRLRLQKIKPNVTTSSLQLEDSYN